MIVQCDFDGTIIRDNLSVLLREEFAHDSWRQIEADYVRGQLTVEQSNKLQYTFVQERKETLREFIRQNINIRSGFKEFVDYCKANGIQFVIVSSGLDLYIELVLAEIGMADLELHCAHSSFIDNGISVSYTDPEGKDIDGGFKVSHLLWLRKRGGKIIYIGDGLSDLEATLQADYVFATGHLFRLLNARSVACKGFDDFHDILREMPLLLTNQT